MSPIFLRPPKLGGGGAFDHPLKVVLAPFGVKLWRYGIRPIRLVEILGNGYRRCRSLLGVGVRWLAVHRRIHAERLRSGRRVLWFEMTKCLHTRGVVGEQAGSLFVEQV